MIHIGKLKSSFEDLHYNGPLFHLYLYQNKLEWFKESTPA